MGFHRLAVPSYFGGLPGGYDYINNAISGTPANTDGAKVGGPNAGTYFDAFGEDATSANANRGNKALAQNTDFIDDLLHADLAVPTRTANVTPGGPVTSITITGPGIFLGGSGDELQDLFHITDGNDDDIEITGTKVAAASITSGGALGSGFSAGNVTILLTVAIPTGQTYRVWYGTRGNLATLPSDALVAMRVRSAVQVDSQTEELFRLLHGNSEAWNGAWDADIFTLNQNTLALRTILANLHGNSEAYNAAWDNTIYDITQNFRRRVPMMWNPSVATSTKNLKHGAWSTVDQLWIATGDGGTDFALMSTNYGQSWATPGGTFPVTGNVIADICFNSNGDYFTLWQASAGVAASPRTAYATWTGAANTGALTHAVSDGRCAWEATAGKVIYIYRFGAGGLFCDTAANGYTVTNHALPAAWSGYTGTHGNPVIKAIPGRAVAAFVDDVNSRFHIAYSTNGGTTWTDTSFPTAFSAVTSVVTHPAYDAVTGLWIIAVFDTALQQTQFFTSTDGATWMIGPTKPVMLHGIAFVDGIFVALDNNGNVYLSNDSTLVNAMSFCFHLAQTNAVQLYLRQGGGGLMMWNSGDKTSYATTIRAGILSEMTTLI